MLLTIRPAHCSENSLPDAVGINKIRRRLVDKKMHRRRRGSGIYLSRSFHICSRPKQSLLLINKAKAVIEHSGLAAPTSTMAAWAAVELAAYGPSINHRGCACAREQSNETMERLMTQQAITLAVARQIIEAGEAKAAEIGQPMNIAVVDAGGNLVAHVRMDNAWLGSVDIAINKAFTSRAFDISTKELADLSQPGKDFFGIQRADGGKVMTFAGGLPLKNETGIVGAVGVSGGTGKQDQAVAEAAAAAYAAGPSKARGRASR
jgi:uncharacterized protein GlcG (DUF336 family)